MILCGNCGSYTYNTMCCAKGSGLHANSAEVTDPVEHIKLDKEIQDEWDCEILSGTPAYSERDAFFAGFRKGMKYHG
jgi:hypothetical protein